MNPLDIDHIQERVLSYVTSSADLLSCRVNHAWNSIVTRRLQDRRTLRLGLCPSTIGAYYCAISTGEWSLPPATLDLHIYISGTQEQVHDTIKYAELLLALSNRDPDPPRRVKQIRLEPDDNVDVYEDQFYGLVVASAPYLEQLRIRGGFSSRVGPDLTTTDLILPAWMPQEVPLYHKEFPCLISASYDLRYQLNSTETAPAPTRFIGVVNAAPNLDSLQFITCDDRHPTNTTADLTLAAMYSIPKLRNRGAGSAGNQITTLELGIFREDERSLDDGYHMSTDLVVCFCSAGFTRLRCLKIHQHFSFVFTERYLSFMEDYPNIESLEYYYMHRTDCIETSEDLDITLAEGPAQLPNITHFGFYFPEATVNLLRLRLDEMYLASYPRGDKIPIQLTANAAMRIMKNVHLMARLCPNIRSISTDLGGCVALASVAKAPVSDGRFLVPFYNGAIVNDVKTEFLNVDTLAVKMVASSCGVNSGLEQPEDTAKISTAWSKLCPMLHKLVLLEEGPHLPALMTGFLSGLLNLTGITELELHGQSLITEFQKLLLDHPTSVSLLKENLRELSLLRSVGGKYIRIQEQRQENRRLDLRCVIDSFQRLQSVTVKGYDPYGEDFSKFAV